MTFVAQIKADGSQFQTTVDALATKLTGLETKAKQTGDTTTTAFDKAGGSTEGLNDKLSGVAGAFDKLAQAIKREQDMLQQINGPAQRYEQNLQTLDALLGKNKISTEQYAEQVRKLNAEIERGSSVKTTAPAAAPTASAPEGINFGEGAKSLKESIAPLVEAYAGFEGAKKIMELSDSYTELSNKLRVVTSDDADLNNVMAQTYQIAQDSRSSWEATATMYQRLKNVTGDLGLSEQQILDLTKEISEAAKISGASQYESQMAMMELTHAFAMGALQGRQFKTMLRDMPAMMHELQIASGMTQEQFAQMGEQGKLTGQLLAKYFDAASSDIQVKFNQLKPTFSDMETQFKNWAEGGVHDLGSAFIDLGDKVTGLGDDLKKDAEFQAHFAQTMEAATEQMAQMRAAGEKLNEQLDDMYNKTYGIAGGFKAWGSGISMMQSLRIELDYIAKKLGGDLAPQVASSDTLKKASDDLADLKAKAEAGKVVVDKLYDAMAKGKDGLPDPNSLNQMQTQAMEKAIIAQQRYEDALRGYSPEVDAIKVKEIERKFAVDGFAKALHDGVFNQKEYNEAMRSAEDPADRHTKALHKLTEEEQARKKILDDINGPLKRYSLDLQVLNDLVAHGVINLQQYNDELARLGQTNARGLADFTAKFAPDAISGGRLNTGASTTGNVGLFGAGALGIPSEAMLGQAAKQALAYQDPAKLTEQWRKEMEAFQASAKKTGAALQQLFDPVVNAIDNAFKTGNFDIKALGASMLDMLEQMILKALEFKAISAIIGVPYGSGGAGGLASLMGLGGSDIPHFANGGDVTFGGSGGTDSQLFMAHVTPGEHAFFRTDAQLAQAAQSAQRQDTRPVQVIVQDGGDPRAITAAFASPDFERHVIRIIRKNRLN